MTDDDWTAGFCETPQRPLDSRPQPYKRKPGPAAALRRETIKAVQGLAALGSRPCVVPVYTGIATHGDVNYAVGRLGSADLIVTFHGYAVHLELKAGNDRQSDRQKKFAERVAQAHGVYVLVRTPQDAVDALVRLYNTKVAKLQAK